MSYIKYLYNWYKVRGFKTWDYTTVTYSSDLREYSGRIDLLGPVKYYRSEKEKQVWIQAAKNKRAKSKEIYKKKDAQRMLESAAYLKNVQQIQLFTNDKENQ